MSNVCGTLLTWPTRGSACDHQIETNYGDAGDFWLNLKAQFVWTLKGFQKASKAEIERCLTFMRRLTSIRDSTSHTYFPSRDKIQFPQVVSTTSIESRLSLLFKDARWQQHPQLEKDVTQFEGLSTPCFCSKQLPIHYWLDYMVSKACTSWRCLWSKQVMEQTFCVHSSQLSVISVHCYYCEEIHNSVNISVISNGKHSMTSSQMDLLVKLVRKQFHHIFVRFYMRWIINELWPLHPHLDSPYSPYECWPETA